MLRLYIAHKKYLDRKLLVTEIDLDDDMVQDAMAIILFPRTHVLDHPSAYHYPYLDHWRSWAYRRFQNPLKQETRTNEMAQNLVKEIDKLYHKMLMFIEDYLTKATSACPSREYLCLPHPGGHLTFKDRTVCTRFYVAQCHDTERRRLMRAFLRAVLAQCGNSDLPESTTTKAILAPWAPDVEGFSKLDPHMMFYDTMSLNAYELCRWLACFGFDLARTIVFGTTAGQHGRAIVRQWLKNLAKWGPISQGTYKRLGDRLN
ncbi:hypothetical protein F4678DRAFT_463383 [Xylaria arbuscula]|nr:hypothetical protein F4678DRAFT_463383 [Xylaria arbuscula]